MVSISGLALISLLFLSPPVTPSSSNDKAVVAVADAYSAAMLKGDVAAVMAVYTDDALEMPPNAAPVQGRADLEAYYKKQLSGMKVASFTLEHIDSKASGDFAYDVGFYKQSGTPTGATAPVSDSGKYIVLLRKSGGKWKVRYVCYNSDNPPPPMSHSH
jgi:ketosteroid isomerase-like protein